MSKIGDFFEKLESEKEDASKNESKIVKNRTSKIFSVVWSFVKNNWLLILIAYFCFQAMTYAEDAARYARNSEDYAADASHYARYASDYAETAADYAETAADYSEQAADDASYLRRWSY